MTPLEITWVVPDSKNDLDSSADIIGGDGWGMTENVAARQYFAGQVFYTVVNGDVALAVPIRNRFGGYYFRTRADSVLANNLGTMARPDLRGFVMPPARGGIGQQQVRAALGRA